MVFACPRTSSLVFFLSGEGGTRGDPGSVQVHFRFAAWVRDMLCWWRWHGDRCCSAFCSLHYLRFKTAFNVRGQTITCGSSIFWASAVMWQQFSSVFPEQVSCPSCCLPGVALRWLLPVSDGMNAKRIFPCWFLQRWEELRSCNDFSQFLLYLSG